MVSQAQSPIRGVRQSLRAVRHSLRSSSNRLRRSPRGPEGVAAILEERECPPPPSVSDSEAIPLQLVYGQPPEGGGGGGSGGRGLVRQLPLLHVLLQGAGCQADRRVRLQS